MMRRIKVMLQKRILGVLGAAMRSIMRIMAIIRVIGL